MIIQQAKQIITPLANKTIAILVSGGVDSCVASMLLKRRASEGSTKLIGVFMRNWEDDEQDERCRSKYEEDRVDAQFVCDRLGIEFREVNFVRQYWNFVFTSFMRDYESGLTPNPDILCNQRIKFGAFLDYAVHQLNCDLIATGHYAGTSNGPLFENGLNQESVKLLRAADDLKDQTFFLSQVEGGALRRVIFPLEHYRKSEVRRIASEAGFTRINNRKSSKGICFIGKRNYQQFIDKYMQPRPGQFIDLDTQSVVGEHRGFHYWTIGQHARIQNNEYKTKYFVARKSDPSENIIYVVSSPNHERLFSNRFSTLKPHWINGEPLQLTESGVFDCQYKFQQTDPLANCTITKINDDLLEVALAAKQRALTPGQYAVFYSNNECLGNGRIKDVH